MPSAFQSGWNDRQAGKDRYTDTPMWSAEAKTQWRKGWDAADAQIDYSTRRDKFEALLQRADRAYELQTLREVVKDLIELVKEKTEQL